MRIGNSLTAGLYSEPSQMADRKMQPTTKSITYIGMKVFTEDPPEKDKQPDPVSEEFRHRVLMDDNPNGVGCTIM